MSPRRIALPLVQGHAPEDPRSPGADPVDAVQAAALRALARRCTIGSVEHRAVVHIAATLAQHAVDSCLPPASRAVPGRCLAEIRRWCAAPFAIRSRALGNAVTAALADAQAATAQAVTRMLESSTAATHGPLQNHANHVIVRHARVASYHAVAAVVVTVDALDRPPAGVDIPAQVAGALAHRATWSACARDGQLQQDAWDQASWLHDHRASDPGESEGTDMLAVQLFHEFIGVSWKAQRDAHASRLFAFVDWALASRHRAEH